MDALPERHTKLLLAYGLIMAVAWALVTLSTNVKAVELVIAALLQGLAGVMLWFWRPGTRSTRRFMLGTAALVASVALMRDASGSTPGVSVLDLLPMMLAAARSSRRELVFAWVLSAVAMCLPVVAVGGARYPTVGLRGVTLLLLVGIVVAATVMALVSELSNEQRRQRELVEDARTQLATEDALRQVATLVASGAPATELFSEVSQQLARIAGASMGAVVRFSEDLNVGEMVGAWRWDRRILSGRKIDLRASRAPPRPSRPRSSCGAGCGAQPVPCSRRARRSRSAFRRGSSASPSWWRWRSPTPTTSLSSSSTPRSTR
jgi:hypothetical protein